MKLIFLLFRLAPRAISLAVVAGVVSGLSNVALLALVNRAIHDRQAFLENSLLLWAFLGLCLLLPAARLLSTYVISLLGQRTVLDLRVKLTRQILSAPLHRTELLGESRLISALTEDSMSLVGALTSIPGLCINLAIVAGCLAYMGVLSGTLLALFAVFLVVGVLSYQIPVQKAAALQREARRHGDELWAHFRTATAGQKEMKMHAPRRGAYMGALRDTGRSLLRLSLRTSVIFAATNSWIQLLIFVVMGGMLFVVPGRITFDPAVLTGYTLLILYMIGPMESLLATIPMMSRGRISLDRIEELQQLLSEEPGAADDTPEVPAEWREIVLDKVVHVYDRNGEQGVVNGPNSLTLVPGQVLFLIGGNGSGKTTLMKVLVGLYVPQGGEIRVDGVPVAGAGREIYRNRFSVIFSDFHLWPTLLGGGTPELDARATQYLRELELHNVVKVENGRFSTTALSQGQRKRLALVSAYLDDRPIYVFDEWAADQDPRFKEVFYLRILPELRERGKTVVAITHDERYFHVADRVLRMEDGRIAYDGSTRSYVETGLRNFRTQALGLLNPSSRSRR